MDVREDLAYEESDYITEGSGRSQKSKKTDVGAQKPTRCFTNLFFVISFLLAISCFLDLCGFLCYYQNIKNKNVYNPIIFYLRVVNDAFLILPLLLYLQWAINESFRYFLVGFFTFLPQIVLSAISLIMLLLQDFKHDSQISEDEQISKTRFITLKASNITNLILLVLSTIATLFKVHNNF